MRAGSYTYTVGSGLLPGRNTAMLCWHGDRERAFQAIKRAEESGGLARPSLFPNCLTSLQLNNIPTKVDSASLQLLTDSVQSSSNSGQFSAGHTEGQCSNSSTAALSELSSVDICQG